MSHLKNLEVLIRDSKVNPSLHPSYYASVTGALFGNEGSKTMPMSKQQAEAAAAGQHQNEDNDDDDGDESDDEHDGGGDKSKAKRRKTHRKGGAKGAASTHHADSGVMLAEGHASAAASSSSSSASKAAVAAGPHTAVPLFLSDGGVGVAVSSSGLLDDTLLPAFPLASQFPSSSMPSEPAPADAGGHGLRKATTQTTPLLPVIAATITPSSITIAPTGAGAQPTTVTVETYMDAIMQQHAQQMQQQLP